MKIPVTVKPGAHENKIEKRPDEFVISVHASPERGRANEAVVRLVAEYFEVSPSRIKIISGHMSRKKLLEIL